MTIDDCFSVTVKIEKSEGKIGGEQRCNIFSRREGRWKGRGSVGWKGGFRKSRAITFRAGHVFNGFRALFAPAFRFPLCVQQDKIYALIVNYPAQGVVT